MKLKEWEKHIKVESVGILCGADAPPEMFTFTSIDHAFCAIRHGSRLLPCPACAKIAADTLIEESR